MASNGRSVSARQSEQPRVIIYCDGRCKRYQDGAKAAWAFYVEDSKGNIKKEQSGLCENRNDVSHIDAEYQAVIEGLNWAVARAAGSSVEVCTNLELIEQQVNGTCKTKTEKLLPLRDKVRELLQKANATLHWIPKKKNRYAHRLSLKPYRARGKGDSSL